MSSSRPAQSAATAARSARLDVSWQGRNLGSLATSNDDAGERLAAAGYSGGACGGLQNDGSLSDDTEDMGNGYDESTIYAGTVSMLRKLLARARKQTERLRASSRSETTKVLEQQNEDLRKELAHTKAALSRAQQEAAAAAAEKALSREVGDQTVAGAQSL